VNRVSAICACEKDNIKRSGMKQNFIESGV
jgi:hypothetical protein